MVPLMWPLVIGVSHLSRVLLQSYLVDRARYGDGTPVRVILNSDYMEYEQSPVFSTLITTEHVGLPAKQRRSSGGTKSQMYKPINTVKCKKGYRYDPKRKLCIKV